MAQGLIYLIAIVIQEPPNHISDYEMKGENPDFQESDYRCLIPMQCPVRCLVLFCLFLEKNE